MKSPQAQSSQPQPSQGAGNPHGAEHPQSPHQEPNGQNHGLEGGERQCDPEPIVRVDPLTADVHSWAEPTTDTERISFWSQASTLLNWQQPWVIPFCHTHADPVTRRGPQLRWFQEGTLNAAVNCVDRHIANGRGEKVALHFEGEPGDREDITYAELSRRVNRAANALGRLGVGPGDRVVIYLPVLVETVVITLACARIGAVHSLVFGGFSAEALNFRVRDTGAKVLVTTDGQYRRGTAVSVKSQADQAVENEGIDQGGSIEHVLVIRRTGNITTPDGAVADLPWDSRDINGDGLGRDVWWHDVVDTASSTHEPEYFPAEHPLFIIYTSGTTGKPKGLVHSTGGYLTGAVFSYLRLFAHPDPEQRASDVHWCTADLAWVTAHTYELYGPLGAGATQVIYEGVPNAPHPGRHFEIIQRYGVTSYYTAPTLVRSLMGWWPEGIPETYDLSSIRIGGTVGEAVNPAAARWLREEIGKDYQGTTSTPPAHTGSDVHSTPSVEPSPATNSPAAAGLPLVDTWWQSESGSTVLSPLPESARFKPGSVARSMPGWSTAVVDDVGNVPAAEAAGNIVLTFAGPSMARTVWGDPERYYSSYWEKYQPQGWFFAGDGARCDADGDTWILGRVDDAINVSGHLLSTIEIESALISHPDVVEAGVAPCYDPTTGHAAVAFVVLKDHAAGSLQSAETDTVQRQEFTHQLRQHVADVIGPIAKPREIIIVPEVPKTRSGKIMRRLLTQLHDHEPLGDTTSLQNEHCINQIAVICGHSSATDAVSNDQSSYSHDVRKESTG